MPKAAEKKRSAEELRGLKLKLISLVEARPAIWDVRLKEHKNNAYLQTLWEEVSQQLDISGDEASTKFRNLRDNFVKEYKKVQLSLRPGPGAGKIYQPKWCLYNRLLFLKDTVFNRRTPGNMAIFCEPLLNELSEGGRISESDNDAEISQMSASSELSQSPDNYEQLSPIRSQTPDLQNRPAKRPRRDTDDFFARHLEILNQQDAVFMASIQQSLAAATRRDDHEVLALSLVTYLRRVPDKDLLECHRELLQTISAFMR